MSHHAQPLSTFLYLLHTHGATHMERDEQIFIKWMGEEGEQKTGYLLRVAKINSVLWIYAFLEMWGWYQGTPSHHPSVWTQLIFLQFSAKEFSKTSLRFGLSSGKKSWYFKGTSRSLNLDNPLYSKVFNHMFLANVLSLYFWFYLFTYFLRPSFTVVAQAVIQYFK